MAKQNDGSSCKLSTSPYYVIFRGLGIYSRVSSLRLDPYYDTASIARETLCFETMASASTSTLPPDLFDQTTIISLLATVAIVATAYLTSRAVLSESTSSALRFLFIWHLGDALCHFILEGSFLYHCFYSWIPMSNIASKTMIPSPVNFLGHTDRVYGAQAGGANPLAQLWMVYARADKRWAGADLVSYSQ